MKIYIKAFTIKSNYQDINYDHFPKPGILFRRFECLKLLRRNHYKRISRVEFVENRLVKR